MEGKNSWADQWDTSERPEKKAEGGGAWGTSARYKEKVGEGLEKTKSAATSGLKKVKAGTSLGLSWVKDKYHKSTNKN
ncbi:PREDICTED: uncharacterized protein LOC104821473 [Tarenaya hassleriana]|uniref:uncharacterized protein LOC104821473 n=1 Tax=Tarenaya hassleriana TaxID=28532 RepID=UPI00053C0E51|nr:PREDICTED: uncharacterized protein LOC104821473 [Tarenaya hassleriana]